MVARSGAIMPEPLAMPARRDARARRRARSREAHFGTVSVVMIARAASRETVGRERARGVARRRARIFAIGSGWPITPVEATSTSLAARAERARRQRPPSRRRRAARARPSPRSSSRC